MIILLCNNLTQILPLHKDVDQSQQFCNYLAHLWKFRILAKLFDKLWQNFSFLKPYLSIQSNFWTYKASQMICFRNKTFEKHPIKVSLRRKISHVKRKWKNIAQCNSLYILSVNSPLVHGFLLVVNKVGDQVVEAWFDEIIIVGLISSEAVDATEAGAM